MTIHERAVYATQPVALQQQINELFKDVDSSAGEGQVIAVVVPASNLLRGGPVSAAVFKALTHLDFETVIVVAPSNTGVFQRLTICSVNTYPTPLGDVTVNDQVRNELCDEDDDIFLDDTGHYQAAGADVQLPFLQTLNDAFRVVPIVMGEETPALCKELGQAVAEVMYNRRMLVVACADILGATEESLAQFRTYLETLDIPRLMNLLNGDSIKVNGKGAVLVAAIAALQRRADSARVLHLALPADGAPGYMGAILYRK